MTVPIRSMPDLIAGLRASVVQRGVAFETVDDISGLPDRYTSKLLAPNPIKNLGFLSIEGVLGALGKALVLVDDPEQIERVKGRWKPSKRPMKLASASISASMIPAIQEAPEPQRKPVDLNHMKRIAKLGAKRRNKVMKRRARQRAASHAARMRWSKRHA